MCAMARGSHIDRLGPRQFISILALGTIACAGMFAKAKSSVPGMSQFTETDFGFSFWYPAAWSVTDEFVADPTSGGWFQGATIVKELKIQNPAASEDNDQPPGVVLDEILAPEGLTELGQSKSASPVGVEVLLRQRNTRLDVFTTVGCTQWSTSFDVPSGDSAEDYGRASYFRRGRAAWGRGDCAT